MPHSTIYEFDSLVREQPGLPCAENVHAVSAGVYDWLEERCVGTASDERATWLKLTQRGRRRAVQVTGFVGVLRAPNGEQIEVLPKVGRAIGGGAVEARQLLIDMLCCLPAFQHLQTDSAKITAARMPLLEVFIAEFLRAVGAIVKRGLRGAYVTRRGNFQALRGRLIVADHLRQNLVRADRFFTEHHELSVDRPENRIVRSALRRVLALTVSAENQRLARELAFAFADVSESKQPRVDLQLTRLDRGMSYYAESIAWAKLILEEQSPLTGSGGHVAPSLLFPMEKVFEAFVAKHLRKQLERPFVLRSQVREHHLVRHMGRDWFQLRPDLVVRQSADCVLVLDTKWKLLDSLKANGSGKYGLSQGDFYQLQAYGQGYLGRQGDVVLIYPKTDAFDRALPVFEFVQSSELRLWVVPFCIKTRTLEVPADSPFALRFRQLESSAL